MNTGLTFDLKISLSSLAAEVLFFIQGMRLHDTNTDALERQSKVIQQIQSAYGLNTVYIISMIARMWSTGL